MNNSDFQKLLHTGGGGAKSLALASSSSSKEKFDLTQVAEFDKQNRLEESRKTKFSLKPSRIASGGKREKGSNDKNSSSGYRDRASERRSGEESQMDTLARALPAEQTQLLGGDIEYTHLVKGLDYTLLQKSRQGHDLDSRRQASGPPGIPVQSGPPGMPVSAAAASLKELHRENQERLAESDRNTLPVTAMGRALKATLSAATSRLSEEKSTNSTSTSTILQRTQYEFILLPAEDDHFALPTVLTKSRSEIDADEAMTDCRVPSRVLQRVLQAFQQLAVSRKRKREKKEVSSVPEVSHMPAAPPVAQVDIFAGVGSYVPVGALDAHEISSVALSWSTAITSTSDLFGGSSVASTVASTSVEYDSRISMISAVINAEHAALGLREKELEGGKKSSLKIAQGSEYDIFPDSGYLDADYSGGDDEGEEEKREKRSVLGVKKKSHRDSDLQ